MIVLNIVDQLFQQITAVVDLKKSSVLLVRINACNLLVAITQASATWLRVHRHIRPFILTAAWIEHITCWCMHFLVKVKHLNDVGFLSVARST